MPYCNGDKSCKTGKPHQLASKDVLDNLSIKQLKKVALGKKTLCIGPCGGKVVLGSRAIQYARRKLKNTAASAKAQITLETLIKSFDDIFTSRMDVKAPGTYLLVDGKPIAFVSFDASSGKIVSREIFSPLDRDTADRVMQFIKAKIPDANLQEEVPTSKIPETTGGSSSNREVRG